jgi:hypothetical protein
LSATRSTSTGKGRVAWLARANVAWRGVDVWMPAVDLEKVDGED